MSPGGTRGLPFARTAGDRRPCAACRQKPLFPDGLEGTAAGISPDTAKSVRLMRLEAPAALPPKAPAMGSLGARKMRSPISGKKRKAPQSGEPDRGRLRRCLPALEGDMAGAAAVPWPYR